MERLTKVYPSGAWGITGELDDAILRLAAYEETGLEPEEIAKIREDVENGYLKSTARRYGISVARLRELAQADREGRCVVLDDLTVADLQQMLTVLDSTRYGDGAETYQPAIEMGIETGELRFCAMCLGSMKEPAPRPRLH